MTDPITAGQVRALAALADLPLGEDRFERVAELLSAWAPAANELSRMMSEPEHSSLLPITVVTQPAASEGRE